MPTFTEEIGSHWRIRCVYSLSQSESGNYTDITMDTYWESTDSYGTTYTSDTKSGHSNIDGKRENFTFSAKLTGKQSKRVNSGHKIKVEHDDEGKARVTLSASLSLELTLGSWVGTRTASTTVTLPTIPRKSKMTTAPDWTACSNRTVSISRASSKFRHEIEMSVKNRDGSWRWVNQIAYSTSQTSLSTGFSEGGHRATLQALDGRASAESRFVLQTYSGSDLIGSNTYYGDVTAPSASDIDSINGQHGGTSNYNLKVYVNQSIKFGIKRANSSFTHTVIVTAGSFSKTFTNVGDELTFTLTSAEQTTLYNLMKTTDNIDGNIEVKTFYNGEQVRGSTNSDLDFYIKASENAPTFPASSVTYLDVNAVTKAITGNDQLIIQAKSTLRVNITTGATMKNGATFARYVISIDGQEKPLLTPTGNVEFSSIKGDTNQVLTVKAVDSRGLMTTVTKTVLVQAYSSPSLIIKATRENLFGENTTIKINGVFSSLNGKNTAKTLQYRITNKGTGNVEKDWTTVTPVKTTSSYTTSFVYVLNVTGKYNIEARVTDNLNTTITSLVSVEAGQPILFIDAEKRSLGFNDFPTGNGEFKLNGRITFGANMYANENSGEGFGALWLNNSDIGGVNGLFFNDVANNKGEGLHFLLSTAEAGSPFNADYNTWHIRDGGFYLDLTNYMTMSEKSGSTNNASVRIGAGGLVIIGAGESQDTAYAGQVTNGTWNDSTERLIVASDTDVHIMTELQGGFAGRQEFIFTGTELQGANGITIKSKDGGAYMMFLKDGSGGGVQSKTIYDRTYSAAANVHITAYGTLGRSTSATKYKTDILEESDLAIAERILELTPKSWFDKTQSYEKMFRDMGFGEFPELPDELSRYHGFIAEDLVEAGLTQFITYGDKGQIEAIQYERLWTLLVPVVKSLKAEVEDLKARMNTV